MPSLARPLFIQIDTPVPERRVAPAWGDWHFARSLAAQLQGLGHHARVHCRDSTPAPPGFEPDAVLTLRGRYSKAIDQRHLNLMWLISHPEAVDPHELDLHDHIFVASHPHARALRRLTSTSVSVLPQAAAPELLTPRPSVEETPAWPVLFVGNSRQQYRRMVQWCLQEGIEVAVYGEMWSGLIPSRYIMGNHIPNDRLGDYYRRCDLLLNDHWDSMRESGFISNRLYDAGACETLVLTDAVVGLESDFPHSHEAVHSAQELRTKVQYYLEHPEERRVRAAAARREVEERHTFLHRALTIEDTIYTLLPKLRLRRQLGASGHTTLAAVPRD